MKPPVVNVMATEVLDGGTRTRQSLDLSIKDASDKLFGGKVAAIEPLVVSVKEAASMLGVSPWTIRQLVAEGHLPTVKLPSVKHVGESGKRVLISVADLKKFVVQHRTGGPA